MKRDRNAILKFCFYVMTEMSFVFMLFWAE